MSRTVTQYLAEGVKNGSINPEVVELGQELYVALDKALAGRVAVPDVYASPGGTVHLSWWDGNYYADLEVFHDGRVEFFWSIPAEGKVWDLEFLISDPVPPEVVKWLDDFQKRSGLTSQRRR